jgi:hypothetical protein
VGYFTGAIKNHSRVRCPTGTILHGENSSTPNTERQSKGGHLQVTMPYAVCIKFD